jgi:hypothetical protein
MSDPRDNQSDNQFDDQADVPVGYWPDDPDQPFEYHDPHTGEVARIDLSDAGCTWCLGGFAPAGTHQILGLVYVACMHCADICRCCDGIGLFPADTTCPHCLAEALAAVGYTAGFCHTCAGVLTVTPMTEAIS